jgi:transposase
MEGLKQIGLGDAMRRRGGARASGRMTSRLKRSGRGEARRKISGPRGPRKPLKSLDSGSEVFVGMDVSKSRIAVALAQGGRAGEVRFLGEIEADDATVTKLVRRLSAKHGKLAFWYEAGPTGYGLYRPIGALGHACEVVAPSLIPRKPGDRVKTNRRDAVSLARLLRAGELTGVWAPDERHEAMGDLTRARSDAAADLKVKRRKTGAFLLRLGRIYPGKKT